MAKDDRLKLALASVKITLLAQQRERCAYCGRRKDQYTGLDFHHVLFREGRARTVEQKLALLSPINGRLVCHTCHVPEKPDLNVVCCKRLIEQFGTGEIEKWVAELPIQDKSLLDAYEQAKGELDVAIIP